jgi:hypothetical protein
MHFENSFYYGLDHNVKAANKRLLKPLGFVIRVPIPVYKYFQTNLTEGVYGKNTARRGLFL